MYCLFASPLVMLLLASVDCAANGEQFKSEPSLTNRVCPADRRLFEKQTVSRVACMAVASQEAGCMAVAYNKEKQMCYGCDTATCELETLEGTMFYSRPKAYHDGFQNISGYILMVINHPFDQGLSYDQAHDACAVHSASLVRFDSSEKQTAITNHISGTYYWIQCHRDTSDGVWKFDDGTPVPMTNDFWASSLPGNTTGHECGYLHLKMFSISWRNFHSCDAFLGYICEIK